MGIALGARASAAGPPGLQTIFPPAVQRGVENEIRVFGRDLASEIELHLPFAAEIRGGGNSSEAARFTIKPASDVAPGTYPVRVRTPDGISNLRFITVVDVPVVRVSEPNGRYRVGAVDLEQVQPIQWPCVVAGHRLERELDVFRFAVPAGQRLTFATEAWRLGLTPDPLIRLRDARGKTLSYAHDTPTLGRDERLDWTFPEAGEFLLEMQSTGGGGWSNHYLVKVGPFNYARSVFPLGGRRGESAWFRVVDRDGRATTVESRVPDDEWADQWRLRLKDFPDGSPDWTLASGDLPDTLEDESSTEPQFVAWPVTINGRIAAPGEADTFRVAVRPGQILRVRVDAHHFGSRLDGYLLVYDPTDRKLLAKHDDQIYRGLPDPAVDVEVPDGASELEIALCDALGRGGDEFGYRLTIEHGGPDFFLWLGRKQHPTNLEDDGWHRLDRSDTLSLPPGQPTKLRLSVRRTAKQDDPYYNGPVQGYSGPIHIKAANLPTGVTVEPLVIEPGQTEAELTVTASPGAPRQPFEIAVYGEGTRPDGSVIRRVAERRLYLSDPQSPHLPWNWRVTKVTCATTREPASPQEAKP
jgi:hypothetical protein